MPDPIRRLLCRTGLHGYPRSQGVVGYCPRGCGDLRSAAIGSHLAVLYVSPHIDAAYVMQHAAQGPPPARDA